jgi:hypothetical protein
MPHQIIFEERAVAFIDILGFKSLLNNACHSQQTLTLLENLVNLLDLAIPNLNGSVSPNVPLNLIPQHIYISDCIILSAPLTSCDMPSYCGLSAIVMRAIQLSHCILQAGYLVSGGISVGRVWHKNSNILGPAYQRIDGVRLD